MHSYFRVLFDSAADILPLFLVAIFFGALIEEFVSERFIVRFLTGRNPLTMALAALVGALIPLCTCGMVPLAVALRRRGGDVKHIFCFLTAGAAVSIPVLLLTWRIIGLRWMLVRLAASVALGLLVGYTSRVVMRDPGAPEEIAPTLDQPPSDLAPVERRSRFHAVWRHFLSQLREYAPWVLVSLVVAALVNQLVPGHWIQVLYGQRTTVGSLLASLTGVPFYFCSGAELPLVRELLAKGMGFGPAIAMMLAVPIVNVPTFGVVSRWIGARGASAYLLLVILFATILGTAAAFL